MLSRPYRFLGMGKTTVGGDVAARGVAVLDADASCIGSMRAMPLPHVEAAFPGTDGARQGRSRKNSPPRVAGAGRLSRRLEAIVHPLVATGEWRSRAKQAARAPHHAARYSAAFRDRRRKLGRCDCGRVERAETSRPRACWPAGHDAGASWPRSAARQMPDAEKRARADFVIDTGLPLDETKAQVDHLLESLKNRTGEKFGLWRRLYEDAPGPISGGPRMREFVMDTETTGLDPQSGDRLVEIACVELSNYIPTGRVWHQYINPRARHAARGFPRPRPVDRIPSRTSRYSPKSQISFLEFVDGGKLVFHNASFDMGFINAELTRIEAGRRSRLTVSSTRWRWRGASTRRARTASTRSASATTSTTRHAPSMARCSTPSCSPRSICSLSAASQPGLRPAARRAGFEKGGTGARATRKRPQLAAGQYGRRRAGGTCRIRRGAGSGCLVAALWIAAGVLLDRCLFGRRLIFHNPLPVKRGEVDRIEKQRRKAAFARQIADEASCKRE